MALVGNRYIQATDPGAVGFGYQWANSSTGLVQERNTSNSAWVAVGSANSACYGAVLSSGGTLTGALSGATGLVKTDASTPFTSQPSVESGTSLDPLVMQSQLEEAISGLASSISSSSSSSGTTVSINDNIKFLSGLSDETDGGYPLEDMVDTDCFAIPYPWFNDRQATIDECQFVVWPYNWHLNTGTTVNDLNLRPSPITANRQKWCCWSTNSDGESQPGRFYYLVIAIKATS